MTLMEIVLVLICIETQKFVKKMERRLQKRRVLPDLSTMFLSRRVKSDSVVYQSKKNNGRAYETKFGDKEHQFDYCFGFDTNAKSKFVRISFDRLSKFNRLPVVYTTIYQKENDKNVYFGNFFFHWLEIEQIGKILSEISKFEFNIEKTISTRQEISFIPLRYQTSNLSYVGKIQ